MRKAIRLTGRRQLNQSAFHLQLADVNGKKFAALGVSDVAHLKSFPVDAEVRLKLTENKLVEIIRFGTVGKPIEISEIAEQSFLAPSCQIRIVSRTNEGLLLGSTTPWTYRSNGQPEGILLFQEAEIAPRMWKLNIQDEGYPVLYVDKGVPDASLWAKTNPIFTACVLPSVIAEILTFIFATGSAPEDGWALDWMNWTAALVPGTKPPYNLDSKEQKDWIDQLIDCFAWKHHLAESVIRHLGGVEQ